MRLETVLGTEILYEASGEIRLGHIYPEVDVIKDMIKVYRPNWFIELGVHEGGLSYILMRQFPILQYFGIKLDCSIVRPEVRRLFDRQPNYLYCGDCFSSLVYESLKYIVQTSKTGIFYCDGGNKAKEINFFADIMKRGDIIMCHDYYDESREPTGLDGFGTTLEFPKPEVLFSDIEGFYRSDDNWQVLTDPDFTETRIIAFMRK